MKVIPASSYTYRQQVEKEKASKPKPQLFNIRKILTIILIILIFVLLITIIILLIKIFSSNKNDTKCHEGFFNPSDHKLMCYQCAVAHCKECMGEVNNNICKSCFEGFIPRFNDKKEIIDCLSNEVILCGNECLSCNSEEKICTKCKSGYYVPDDSENKSNCEKCSLENCQSCHGIKNSDICDLCENNYESEIENGTIILCKSKNNCEIGEGEKCMTCSDIDNKCGSCNPSYELVDGKCVKEEEQNEFLSFKAKLVSSNPRENIKIIGDGKNKFIQKINVDGKINTTYVNEEGYYNFESVGEHTIDVWLELTNDIFVELFVNCTDLKSVSFNSYKKNDSIKMISMEKMFYNCKRLTSFDISNLDTSYIENIDFLFSYCISLKTLDLSKNKFENVLNATGPFSFCYSITSINLDTSLPRLKYFDHAFYNCSSLISLDLSLLNVRDLKDINNLVSECTSLKTINLNNFPTDLVTDMSGIFYNCISLTSVDLSFFNTKNVKNMNHFFYNCHSLTSIDITNFDTSKVTGMKSMFYNCSLSSIDVTKFDTSNVEIMEYMFGNCAYLTSLDLSKFKTNKVNNMHEMLNSCKKLASIDVSSFDTSQVTLFEHMFSNCISLTSLDLHNFNFRKNELTDHDFYFSDDIFVNCSSLTSIDITTVNKVSIHFFDGLPTTGNIKYNSRLKMYISTKNYLPQWNWTLV